jgi:hypothetical protein
MLKVPFLFSKNKIKEMIDKENEYLRLFVIFPVLFWQSLKLIQAKGLR